jgi:hypothetical protein
MSQLNKLKGRFENRSTPFGLAYNRLVYNNMNRRTALGNDGDLDRRDIAHGVASHPVAVPGGRQGTHTRLFAAGVNIFYHRRLAVASPIANGGVALKGVRRSASVTRAWRRFKDAAPQPEPPLTIPAPGAILRQMSRFSGELWSLPANRPPPPSQQPMLPPRTSLAQECRSLHKNMVGKLNYCAKPSRPEEVIELPSGLDESDSSLDGTN